MTQKVLDVSRSSDPRVTDADIAAAVRELGFNKPVRDDNPEYTLEEFLDKVMDKALIHSAMREQRNEIS